MGLGASYLLNFADLYSKVVVTCAGNEWLMMKLQEENNGPLKLQHVKKSANVELELKTKILPKKILKNFSVVRNYEV